MDGYYDDGYFDGPEPFEDDLMDWENRAAWADGMADAESDAALHDDFVFPDDPSLFDDDED